MFSVGVLAERVGFEPTLEFPLNTLSKRAPSATRPSLHLVVNLYEFNISGCCRERMGCLSQTVGNAFLPWDEIVYMAKATGL